MGASAKEEARLAAAEPSGSEERGRGVLRSPRWPAALSSGGLRLLVEVEDDGRGEAIVDVSWPQVLGTIESAEVEHGGRPGCVRLAYATALVEVWLRNNDVARLDLTS